MVDIKNNGFKAVKIKDNVYWVGAIDWNVRDFHGYRTNRGSTYNAYLILGSKNILIDTVKKEFSTELLERISSVINVEDIDVIISNHAEMDHSGALVSVINKVKPQKVYVSQAGKKALLAHFQDEISESLLEVVSNTDLNIDGEEFSFIDTKMLHWPDSMISFHKNSGILFSQDAFGMHLATSERFSDEIPESILEEEAIRYYANILLPFSTIVSKQVKALLDKNLDIKVIASDHGPIWRNKEGIEKIVSNYLKWAEQRKDNKKAVIVYDTMWKSTDIMARSIADGLKNEGMKVVCMKMGACHRSDVITEIMDASILIVGSPTINRQIFPTVADVLTYVKGLSPKNVLCSSFGSYGWSGEAVAIISKYFEEMKLEYVEGLRVNYVPSKMELASCYEFGSTLASKLK